MSAAAAHRLHGEIETARPLRAKDGKVSITGWCLAEDLTVAPAVRLATAGGILPMTARTEPSKSTGITMMLSGADAPSPELIRT